MSWRQSKSWKWWEKKLLDKLDMNWFGKKLDHVFFWALTVRCFTQTVFIWYIECRELWDYSQGCQCLWIIPWQWCPREKVPPGLSRCNQESLVSVSQPHLSSQFKWVKVTEGLCIVISFLLFWKVWSLVSRLFRTSGFHFYPLFKNKEIKQFNFYLFII